MSRGLSGGDTKFLTGTGQYRAELFACPLCPKTKWAVRQPQCSRCHVWMQLAED